MSYGNRQYVDEPAVPSDAPVRLSDPVFVATTGGRASSLVAAGVVTMLVGIWGAIVPFMGPTFGFSADGSKAWQLTAAHFWLAVLAGGVAFVAGLLMLLAAPPTVSGSGRSALFASGLLAVLAGAWFVVGPLSWPVVSSASAYFTAASPLRELAFQIGYSFGPGMIALVTGGFALAWSVVIDSRRSGAATGPRPVAPRLAVTDDSVVVESAPPVTTVSRPAYEQPM